MFTTGQVLTAAQMTSLQQTAMLGGAANAKTASYVLVAADAGAAITMSNASATTITVNTGLFAAGDIVTIINLGAGVSTITAGTATVSTSASLSLAQNQGGVLRFTSASAAIFFQFATPASGDIEGVTAGTGISGGGTSGTVTITNSMATEITAKADLIVGTGNAAFDNLAVGTNGHVLTADSTVSPTGLKWAAPAVATSGLTLIKAQTIGSAVASVTVSDAFSATYDNYLITVTGGSAASDSADIVIKFGATTSDYKFVGIYMKTTSSTVNSFATNSAGNITVGGGSSNGFASFITVINPYLTKRTGVIALTGVTHSDMYFEDYKGFLDNATSYTSFIISSGSNLTGGEIRVYGYQNS